VAPPPPPPQISSRPSPECVLDRVDRNPEEDDDPPNYCSGLTHEAIHSHSWRPDSPNWLWISKASAIEGVGFPARKEEIRRFGNLARRVR